MTADQRYRINSPAVIYDRSEGQTVVINLLTGHYFRLDEASSLLWDRLESAPSLATLIDSCVNDGDLTPRLPTIMDELCMHGLITGVDGDATQVAQGAEAWTFRGFTLESFTDLEDILGLDPIHEADPDTGWPQARSA